MLAAFILGFWIIWSSGRDIYAISESLWFTVLIAIVNALVMFQMPVIDNKWLAGYGILWVYTALVFFLVDRFSSSFAATALMAVAAAAGYFFLNDSLPQLVSAVFTKV
ncbi:hypothetical protein [Neisseria chenwenguii]|uniref:Uncharacterized protein n=1 Tax=Neisseria chenwenguii TaxID=1853278 RepID=A0A220S2P9_9NEIS|nr:hypothetical protein [Neisseria chenwenguii]ASK27750.1 hypothetical protein BG910_08365 [Neisseria chenwenguii]ROV56490.1 hypothetical protein EGS38_03665 [Neisseria chenwenguii]